MAVSRKTFGKIEVDEAQFSTLMCLMNDFRKVERSSHVQVKRVNRSIQGVLKNCEVVYGCDDGRLFQKCAPSFYFCGNGQVGRICNYSHDLFPWDATLLKQRRSRVAYVIHGEGSNADIRRAVASAARSSLIVDSSAFIRKQPSNPSCGMFSAGSYARKRMRAIRNNRRERKTARRNVRTSSRGRVRG